MSLLGRWIPPLAAGALVAAAALFAVGALRAAPSTPEEQAALLAAELRCPDCAGVSVAESPTRPAAEIRRQIRQLLGEGRTPDEVRQHFVDRYGEWILLAPRPAVAWLVPVVALVAAVAVLVAWLRPHSAAAAPPPAGGPAATDRRRLHDEAEALDA
jgi:cytochrome c-type biogenesis protein CcmH